MQALSNASSRVLHSAAILAMAVSPVIANATDYSADGSLRLDASHDNNLQLTEAHQSAFGHTTNANVEFGSASELSSASIDAQLWFRRYNLSEFDSDDQTFHTDVSHRFERASIGLRASAVRDSTLTSELLDSGRIVAAQRHEQYSASPNWSYQLGEADLLSLQGSYATSHYQGQGYTDYTYWQTQAQWTHTITERLRGFLVTSYSGYQSAPQQFSFGQSYATASMDRGVQIGGDYQFSENLTASLLGGLTRNHTDAQVKDPLQACPFFEAFGALALVPLCSLRDSDATLTTLNSSVQWSSQRNELALNVVRSTQPSSNGYVQESDQLTLNWRYRVWESGTLGLQLTLGSTDIPNQQSTSSSNRSRDFEYATLSYSHALSETWIVDCNYQYRTQKYQNTDRVESNAAFVGITWKPQTQHWSR